MASHLFSRHNSAKFVLRNRLRRVLLESLERRELMAADLLGYSDLSEPISYTLAGQASQSLAFQTTGDLSGMSPDDVTTYLDSTLGSNSGPINSRAWFPLIEESYSQWSQKNGLAFSYTSSFNGGASDDPTAGLIAEGEAGGPRLLSIAPNSGDIFSFNNVNTLTEAPTELVFRFDGGSGISPATIAGGFKVVRANRDGVFGNGNDQVITPGYLSFGDNNKIIVMRFATTLPDDLYRVMVIGTDNASVTPIETAVRNTGGRTLDVRTVDSTPTDLTRDSIDFKLELGAQVVSVVPQPVDRLASNTVNLVQSGASFVLRAHQGDTTNNAAGTSVSLRLVQFGTTTTAAYDRATNRITVSLATGATVNDVATAINTSLAGNFSVTTVVSGASTVNSLDFGVRTVALNNWGLDLKRDQIRVYFNEDDLFPTAVTTGQLTPNPTVVDPAFYQLILTSDTVQPNDDRIFSASSISYDPLLNLATLTFPQPIDQLAGAGTYRLRIGGRDSVANITDPKTVTPVTVPTDQAGDFTGASAGAFAPVTLNTSTSVILNENILTNSPNDLPLDYPGSNFEPGHRDVQDETHINQTSGDASEQIATVFYNFALNRPYGLDASGRPVSTTITPEQLARVREIFEFYSMVMGIDFVESESAGITFVVGDLFPNNGAQSGAGGSLGNSNVQNNLAILDGAETWDNSFGGQSGLPNAQNFFKNAMYNIGTLLGFGNSSEQPILTVMANNQSPFGEWVFPGDHDVVHGQYLYRPDNRDVDSYKFVVPAGKSGTLSAETIAERLPSSSNLDTYLTLFKQTPTGYEVVAINNDSFSADSFLSAKLTEGTYFISVTGKGNESFNPLIANTGDGAVSQGAYQLKVDFQEDSAAATIVDPAGSALDGDGDGLAGGNFNFWFRTAAPIGVATPGTPKTIFVDKGFAGVQTGSPTSPMNSLDLNNPVKWPTGFVQPGDIIRVVGSLGADRLLSTGSDNPAYEIGRGGVGSATLSDGISLEVPQGVTVMIDAGAILKLGNSRITTGSLDASINKSFSSLQVLGTPRQTVNFTSYNDQAQGTDTNPLITAPQAGDWGGIDLRNNVDRQEGRGDYERKGIFLNYLSHADIRYGGGQITVVNPSPTINPVNLTESRPTLLYNTIRFSADAAIAADPNSFEETRFTEPRYQLAQTFRPDYDRVGPDLRGNIVTNNTVNGLFIRTSTVAGGNLTTLDNAARWDDTDITFVIGENLIIAGTPGGSFLETTAPDVSLVQTADATGGTLVVGQNVLYKVTFVDRNGGQGAPSAATAVKTLTTNAVQLNNLPVATGDFVSRMLWRSTNGGATYRLVAELDGDTTSYKDVGADLAAVLATPNATQVQRARLDARLQIDPGVVVKLSGARIEVGIGAQLIAEGSADRKVIFTSRSDDRYGAGGTFDTNSNGLGTNPGAGDWGGLVARHLSSLSIDQALITFGGGQTSVSGGFAGFNAVEIHQADARVTNSTLEFNGSGLGGNSGATRDGRGPHDASVIYVVGSQPVIAENIIRNNSVTDTAVISINANALNTDNVQDRGRQTGAADLLNAGLGNSGPLVDGNLLGSNGLNGMRVRGEVLTTATVWDDSDIVHILQSEVVVPDLHTYGGLRLQSKSDESLVVKLGTGAGFTATGEPLDIADRIGGSMQIMGSPGFPVVLTSLADDSVGAGFDPNGRPLVDTNNNGASTGTSGSWRSVRIDPYANDRNVDTTFEYEADQIQDIGTNDAPTAAQSLGAIANALNGGDENLRLGFTLHGSIASPKDLDVYSFTGTAGTPVWIDIDQTNGALDTVVELIDSAGNIIAQSNNSLAESLNPNLLFTTPDTTKITADKVQPLDKDPFAPKNSFQPTIATDLYSVNPLDAGMRVVLPGATGGSNTYYIRVRSSNLKPGDPAANLQDTSIAMLRGGLTTGSYRMQVRLQQDDETGGTTVRFADIRFATNGIEANGMPAHSPLLGQVGEQGAAGGNDAPGVMAIGIPSVNFPGLGNIVSSDRGSMSVAGSINGVGDVDMYSFTVRRDQTQSGGAHISTVFDIDYADGLGRPDTTLWVYRIVNGNPTLVLVGTDSNVADDRSAPEQGSDLDALSSGSVGARDPFIGASELPDGDYIVAVSNNSRVAASMQQFQTAAPANPLIRLEPVNSVNRLAVDRIGGTSADTATAAPVLFPLNPLVDGQIVSNNSVSWTLADMTTYVVRNNGTGSQLVYGNAMTGVQEAEISNFVRMNDTAMSPDGRLVGYEINVTAASQTDANSGNFHLINSIGAAGNAATPNNASTVSGNSGIQTFTTQRTDNNTATPTFAVQQRDQNGPTIGGNTPQGDGIQFNGLTYFTQADDSTTLQMFGVGSRGNGELTYNTAVVANGNVTGIGGPVANTTNYVYKLDPVTGAAINPAGVGDRTGTNLVNDGGAGTNKVEYGRFITNGTVTGLAEVGGRLFAVSNLGEFFAANNATDGLSAFGDVNPSLIVRDELNNPIAFTSLTAGPRNLENGKYANTLFGTTANGTIWAISTTGIKQPVFPGFSASVKSNSSPLNGPNANQTVQGIDFSPLDVNLWHASNRRANDAGHGRTVPFDLSQSSDLNGGTSLYFGYEANEQAGTWQGVYNVAAYEGTYNLPGGAKGAIVSNPIDLRGYSADDLPMLYFNYFLATENSNSDLEDSDIRMNDAFRVYAAGEDGAWILLTTNNSDQGGANRTSGVDEFDTAVNSNSDPYGNPLFTQETYDNTGTWRQARTSLAALAGQQNVRLRFEFSSGASFRTGDPLLGGVELTSIQGAKLNDGSNFVINPQDNVTTVAAKTMEFDLGLVLNLPGASSITSGVSQLRIGATTLTFSTTTNGTFNLPYSQNDTPAQIATKVRAKIIGTPAILTALGITATSVTTNSLRPNTLNIAGLAAATFSAATGQATNYSTVSLPADVIEGLPGTEGAIVMQFPGAGVLGSGVSSITFTGNDATPRTLTFSTTSGANGFILYDPADSGAAIAQRVLATLSNGSPISTAIRTSLNVTANDLAANRATLQIRGATAATIAFNAPTLAVPLPPATIISTPTGSTPNLPPVLIPVDQSMTADQVLTAVRTSLAATYTNPASLPAPVGFSTLDAWPIYSQTLRTYKFDLTNFSEVGITNQRNGDFFGVQGSNGNRMDERAQNNAFEGIYIDDIIVGFAERGEMVLNSTAADSLPAFVNNADYSGLGSTFNIAQVEQGAYQLTVRTGADYGIQQGNRIQLGRSFDTNARLAEQVAIQVNAAASGAIRDGITFTLSDGINLATFEFDVTAGANDIATGVAQGNIRVPIAANANTTEIATAIRDAINSPTAQALLKITAGLQGEMTYGSVFGDAAASGSARVLLFGDAAAIRTGNLAFANTTLLSFIRSGNESPMFDPQGGAFGEDLGDVERQREQGQILLVGNTITNSSGFGIVNDAGARNQAAIGNGVGPRPYPGSPIQTPTLNQSNLAPGVVIMNNIVANNTAGGIRVSGDSDNTGMAVPRLIARVINNTVFGGADGILVDDGASPTILNNIIANAGNGVRVTGVTTSAVLGANLFQSNGTNTVGTGTGSFAEPLNPGDPLFVASTIANRRFYLAAGSKAIDSSLDALQERPELTQVKNSIGLPLSPMIAPDLDGTGQRRVDDPTVNSPAGLGGNVFKDRGAVDRSDFLGLNAIILQPQDNDSALADSDRNTTFIQLSEGELEFFSLLLQDVNGTGPDETSVNALGAVSLTENGRLLIPDVDYVFGYNANSRTIRLTPIAGIWRKDSVYEISLNNKAGIRLTIGTGVADGNRYTVTHATGTTVFEFDTGTPAGVSSGAVRVPIQTGYTPYQMAAQLVAAINGAGIGLTSYLQGDGTLMVNGATAITATGAALGTPLTVGGIRDLAGNPLNANRATSLTQFTIIMPEVTVDYGDIAGTQIPTIKLPNSVVAPVVFNGDGARHALLPIDIPLLVLGDFADADNDGAPSPSASGDDSETLFSLGTLASTGATLVNKGSATIVVNRALITDGQQFTITDTIAHPLASVVFEFTTDATTSSPTVVPIQVAVADTSAMVATKVAAAIEAVLKSGRLDNIIPVVDPVASNQVRLVANDGYVFDLSAAAGLTRLANGNVEITLSASIANLDGKQFSFTDGNGKTVSFELNLYDPALPIPVVSANQVAINIPSTVASPTTPAAVASAIAAAINTQLNMRNLLTSLATASGSTISILADDEDGVTFKGVFNAASNPVTVTARSSGAGMLDAWMDWNGDGDFTDVGEQFIVNQPVQAGANNFTLTTPVTAVPGFVNARFRLSTLGSTLAGGVAIGGEVEDYIVEVIEGAPPATVTDSYATNEDSVLNSFISVLANPALAAANQITLVSTVGLAAGDGIVIEEGTASQMLRVASLSGNTVTLTGNLLQAYTAAARVSLTVLGNDTDPNNDPLAIPPIVEPIFVFDENPATAAIDPLVNVSNGTLVLNANGTFTYTPNLDFNGTDRFVYNAVDTRLKSNTPTTVTITVRPINDAPLGVNDTISAIEDEVIVRNGSVFTANDLAHFGIGTSTNASNESGQVLQIINASIISETSTNFGGIAGLNLRVAAKPGQGVYGIRLYVNSADLGAAGTPTVAVQSSTITVTLNSNALAISTVNDLINAINGNSQASALVDLTLTGSGATQIGNVATAYSPVVVPPSGGTFGVAGNVLTYTPPAHYNSNIGGPALLLLTIQDDASAGPTANLTSTSTLTINIAAVNDRPQFDAWPANQEVTTTEDIGLVTVPNFVTGLIPGPSAAVDEANGPILGTAENQSITFTNVPPAPLLVEALNPLLFAVQPTLTVVGTSATLSFQLAQDVNKEAPFGPILVRVTAQDSGLVGGPNNNLNQSITRTFTILPSQVNDAPVFDLPAPPANSTIPIVVSDEDQGVVTIPGFMRNQFPARSTALDELAAGANPAQLPMRVEIVADPNVFVVADPLNGIPSGLPTIDPVTGTLRYQTRKDINRTMPGLNFNVEVTLIDAAGTPGVDRTTKTFAINVTPYNDAPEFVMPNATSAFVEDPNAAPGALTTVPNFVTSIQPGPLTAIDEGPMGGLGENQQVRFRVEAIDATGAVNNSLFDTAPGSLPRITGTDEPNPGTLTYRLRPDINQITPFPQILVRVIAIDTGAPSPGVVQFDPLITTPRNVNASASRTFTILPDPINDAPIFTFNPAVLDATKPAFPTINATEDQGTATVTDFLLNVLPGPVTALDELINQQIITPILVEALDPAAFDGPTGQPRLVLDTATRRATLIFRTAPNVNQNTGNNLQVRITVQDNGGVNKPGDDDTTVATFSISVAPVNDVPSFTLPIVAPAVTPSVRVNEDNGATTLPFATSILAGPTSAVDENTIVPWKQTLFFDVLSNSNPTLFAVQPTIDPITGNLSFRSAAEQNGQAVVVVQLRDQTNDGTTSLSSGPQTFTINITSINDAPEFTPGAAFVDAAGNWISNSIEDQGVVVRPNFATNLRVGPLLATDEANQPQQLTVHVRALDPTAFIDQPAVDASGTLTYRTAADVNMNQSSHDLRVEIFLTDDGIAGPAPHSNISVVRTFTIAAAPINDAPVFSLASSQVDVIEDVEQFTGTSPTAVNNFAFNIRQAAGLLLTPPTATDEATQQLRFDVISVSAPELFIQNANPALDGQPKISPNGQLTFQTAPHKNGKAVVVVRLVEPLAASSPAPNSNTSPTQTFTISISAVNDAPQFDIPGSITYAEDAGLISQNSFATNVRRGPVGSEDENSQEIRFIVTALDPSAFAVQPTIGVDGTLTFQTAPNANALNANLRVRVQLRDNGADDPAPNTNLSLLKTFVINATPVNDPPIPDSFFLDADEDARITIQASAVLNNDEPGPTDDEDGQLLRMTQIERTSAGGGTIIPTFDANNNIVSFDYIPPANLVGPDTFLYVVTDNGIPSRSGTGTITIGLRGINDAPQFLKGADQVVPEDAPLISLPGWATGILPGPPAAADELLTQTVTFNVTANDASLFEVQPSVAANGTLQFKPKLNANGVAVVTVIAVDNGTPVAQSQPQVFTISITAVNDAPVFTAGPSVSVAEDSGAYSQAWASSIFPAAGLRDVPPSANDEAGQVVDFTAVANNPSLFSVQPTVSSSGLLQFTPNRDAFGTALITIRAVDRGPSGALDQNTSAAHTLTITINPVNDAPVASSDIFNTNENSILTLSAPGVLSNDSDVDLPGDQINAIPAVIKSALGADVTVNADGSIVYNPSLVAAIQQLTTGQNVQDTFVYKIKDSFGLESIAATVTVNVAGVNDAPTATNDSYTVGLGQSQLLDVLVNDFDVDSAINAASISVTSLPAFGSVVVNQTGVVQYTPGGGFRGTDTFRYTVRDTAGNVSNEAIVTVTVNSRPIANDDAAFTYKNESVDINVLANDVDSDGTLAAGSVQVVLVPSPSGTATVLPNGSIRFTPATNFVGLVTLSYVVTDNDGSVSNVADIDIRVQRSKWQNPRLALDVNADTFISPIDALLIINKLNDPTFERNLPLSNFVSPPYLDTNGDEQVSPIDALLVINYLNATRSAGGEGEGESNLSATSYAMMVTPQQMIATVGVQVVQELQSELADVLTIGSTASSGSDSSASQFLGWTGLEEEEDSIGMFCTSDEDHESLVDAVDDFFDSIGPELPK